MKTITHYDLFAGIGGFSLALDNVFFDYERRHIFCEWEAFPTAVLKKHWPDATYYGDIADLVADTTRKQDGGVQPERFQSNTGTGNNIIIVTGGFPCQPFSHAGRRKGTADDRYLWPPMLEIIRNVRPDWVIAENVRGLVTWNEGMVLETVCTDLESEGYEVQPLIIPAVAVGAPHRRDRVWIVAHNIGQRSYYKKDEQKLESKGSNQLCVEQSRDTREYETPYTWADDWREVALATCLYTMDDGLPEGLVRPRGWRNAALKAAGNAIVPQVAEQIMRAMQHACMQGK